MRAPSVKVRYESSAKTSDCGWVTNSREHAVRYKLGFDRYLKEQGYTDIKSLVAFSGEISLKEFGDKKFTEVGMNNGIRESELPEKFHTDEYKVLLVAEKYQTGFDQPLLHTMYVDKRLSGIQAVQTLSRLNRTMRGKTDSFVLDFVNAPEEIYKSFKPYFEDTEKGSPSIRSISILSRIHWRIGKCIRLLKSKKLHCAVGDGDTYFLNNAVHMLQNQLDQTLDPHSDATSSTAQHAPLLHRRPIRVHHAGEQRRLDPAHPAQNDRSHARSRAARSRRHLMEILITT